MQCFLVDNRPYLTCALIIISLHTHFKVRVDGAKINSLIECFVLFDFNRIVWY